ncbi:hypothetical protein Scep_028156 [Stephania cephalantha]|uniref:Uncharacterized protein n=1 Tax=Stephania cephalantha TaxID=152367 RepID=A0AAP0E9D8_9MAGN
MFPWFAMGHMISFLRFSNELAAKGHHVSFIVPTKIQFKLKQHNLLPHLISFVPLDVPHVDGLPIGSETMSDVPYLKTNILVVAMDFLEPQLQLPSPLLIPSSSSTISPSTSRKSLVNSAPIGAETIDEALPDGFKEKVKSRGVVHGGWIQQRVILGHGSVWCFVSHCRYRSMWEGLVLSEVQMVVLPQIPDQFLNAQLLSREFRVGVEMERKEEDGWFSRDSVEQ